MEKYIVEVHENVTYWKNESGQLHRLGGLPAVEYADGYKAYWENGQLHRLGGLPAVEYTDGYKAYWIEGKQVTEAEAKKLAEPADPCADKVVTIEGKQYKLTPVK
jgi:hypothetical protein